MGRNRGELALGPPPTCRPA